MGEIIDIRSRRGRGAPERERQDGGTIFRIRLCGAQRQEIEAAGRAIGRAFILEGFYIAFENWEESLLPTCTLRAGREVVTERGGERCPGLVVAADSRTLSRATLRGCNQTTVLLAHGDPRVEPMRGLGFVGTVVPLPIAVLQLDPFGLAAACAGGAARLLGAIRWTALEQGLREEFAGLDQAAVNRLLAMALEAFDRTAPWAGQVTAVREELEELPGG
ncbi:MAG: hypothetical protein IH614_02770 [Desulfuromonadales bacterium]|nr:hypothetical protein [Desulfuromonadales bacterium]